MTNLEKYNQIFIDCFDISASALDQDLKYQSVEEWDSVGHMSLIAEIEEVFEITIDIDDVIEFSSYDEGKKILVKYDLDFA